MHWVELTLVEEVVYRQFTRIDHRLRHAAWRGLREEKAATEVIAPDPTLARTPDRPGEEGVGDVAEQRVTVQVGERRLVLTNLAKEFYPAVGLPRHARDWVRTVRLPSSGSRGGRGDYIDYVLIDDPPTRVGGQPRRARTARPQWTIGPNGREAPDRLVFDLDPGPLTGLRLLHAQVVVHRVRWSLLSHVQAANPKP